MDRSCIGLLSHCYHSTGTNLQCNHNQFYWEKLKCCIGGYMFYMFVNVLCLLIIRLSFWPKCCQIMKIIKMLSKSSVINLYKSLSIWTFLQFSKLSEHVARSSQIYFGKQTIVMPFWIIILLFLLFFWLSVVCCPPSTVCIQVNTEY